ncbi:oligosaccharide flippase family protein [Altererythrobacter salegens]|uniref:Oligosaccharide flippase family protein n=1 Tax=Croceibacterium salegens TaxID=1737568 RepID=A0A6I4T260_9SPHN|nr:oligosaccharide flippase family protein [Croceibacterium salegens]MXO60742.1 oligosaccharide flippase family protein [Croceibacterium salegens]
MALPLIRRLRRKVDQDMRFFQDFGLLTAGQLVSRVLGFLAFAWIARRLEPSDYGAVEYVVGLSIFFATLADGGLGVLGTRRAAHQPDELPLLAYQIPIARLLIVAVGLPVMALMATQALDTQAPAALIWLFAASVIAAPFRQQWLFQASERMSLAAWGDVVRMAVFAIAVWVLLLGRPDILRVAYAEVISVAAVTLYSVYMQHRHVTPLRVSGSMAGFGGLVREGLVIGSTNLVWALNQYLPLFVIGSQMGAVSLAWFAGASRIVVSLIQFSNLYHFNMYPSVAQARAKGGDALAALLKRSARVVGWGGLGGATALTVLDKPLVHAALGEKLLPAAPLLGVMAWMLPLALVSGHARWSLAAAGQQSSVLASQVSGVVVTFIALVLLPPLFGLTGYAIASVTGFIAVWAVSHVLAARHDCAPPSPLILIRPVLMAGVVIGISQAIGDRFAIRAGLLGLALCLAPVIDRQLLADVKQLAGARNRLHEN